LSSSVVSELAGPQGVKAYVNEMCETT